MRIDEARKLLDLPEDQRRVIYRPDLGGGGEEGVVAAVGHVWVFVRFGGDREPQAVSPVGLILAAGADGNGLK